MFISKSERIKSSTLWSEDEWFVHRQFQNHWCQHRLGYCLKRIEQQPESLQIHFHFLRLLYFCILNGFRKRLSANAIRQILRKAPNYAIGRGLPWLSWVSISVGGLPHEIVEEDLSLLDGFVWDLVNSQMHKLTIRLRGK
jgi:hypothetical protein